jgi:UPF0271 protein
VVAEAFADRRSGSDGSLQPRSEPGAVLDDADLATTQAIGIARDGTVQAANGQTVTLHADTLCLHGDGAHAVALARQLRAVLEASRLRIIAPGAA